MGGNGADPSSYWYDACEDVNTLCCIDFASGTELDPTSLPNFDRVADEGFVAEIDRILESINSDPNTLHHEKQEELQVQRKEHIYEQPMAVDVNNVARTREVKRERSSFNGDWREGKKSRDGWGRERGRGSFRRGHWHRGSPRGTFDRRWGKRRERDGTGTDSRDSRGYWERDKSGKMVYHNGSWESETEREAKRARKDGPRENETGLDKKMEEVGRKENIIVEEHARQYQLEVLEHAKKKNTIAFLETGAGKTLIAVLLMKSACTDMMKENKKMLAVFLVPKVPLVYQQAEVIRERTGFCVGHYCGEMGQDFWDLKRWQREFESKQVLVMTAQILLNILRHSIIKMDAINLLILDECHPYSLVMSEFYHTTPKEKRPTVFGMTASPVNLKDRGGREEGEKVEQSDEGDPLPGTARHREFYPEGVAEVLLGKWILSGRDFSHSYQFKLHMYFVNSANEGTSKDPFLNQVSDFSVLFGAELDAEVLSMTMDLFVARSMITKASLVCCGQIEISYSQLVMLKNFHVRLMSIVLDVDVDPSSTPWDPAKAYLFVPVISKNSSNPIKDIDWDLVEAIVKNDAWNNPLHRARPDVYLGTNERTLGGDKREYGFGKLCHGSTTAFGQKVHPPLMASEGQLPNLMW